MVLDHAHPGEVVAAPSAGSPAPSPCAELWQAYHDLKVHTGIAVTRAGQAFALLRELGLPDMGRRFSRLSARRRSAAYPDAPFLRGLRSSLASLDSRFVATTAAAF